VAVAGGVVRARSGESWRRRIRRWSRPSRASREMRGPGRGKPGIARIPARQDGLDAAPRGRGAAGKGLGWTINGHGSTSGAVRPLHHLRRRVVPDRRVLPDSRALPACMAQAGKTVFGDPPPAKACPYCQSSDLPVSATKCFGLRDSITATGVPRGFGTDLLRSFFVAGGVRSAHQAALRAVEEASVPMWKGAALAGQALAAAEPRQVRVPVLTVRRTVRRPRRTDHRQQLLRAPYDHRPILLPWARRRS